MKLAHANEIFMEASVNEKRNLRKRTCSLSDLSENHSSFEKSGDVDESTDHLANNSLLLEKSRSLQSLVEDDDIEIQDDAETPVKNTEDPDPEEDWRKKSTQLIKNRRSKTTILEPKNVVRNFPVLANGHTSTRKVDKKVLICTQTCGFDSLFSIYGVAYVDSDTTRSEYDKTNEPFPKFIRDTIKQKKVDSKSYNSRNQLLYEIYSEPFYQGSKNRPGSVKHEKDMIHVNCSTGIGNLLSRLVSSNESIASFTIKRTCIRCDFTDNKPFSFVGLDVNLMGHDIVNLDQYINYGRQCSNYCDLCSSSMNEEKLYGNIICFEVEPPRKYFQTAYQIKQLKQTIIIEGLCYDLHGVIEHKQNNDHFVAHVQRKNKLWETYDDLENTVKSSKIIPSIFMYMFLIFYKKRDNV